MTGYAGLVEGRDYTLENGLLVFTSGYLKRRGVCCESGCRHCPWRALARPGDDVSDEEEREDL